MMLNKLITIENNAWNEFSQISKQFKKLLIITSNDIYSLFKKEIDRCFLLNKHELFLLNEYSYQQATELVPQIIYKHYDCIVSIGGGSVNDTCKLVAKLSDVFLISIPTTISNDGVCSNISVLKTENFNSSGIPSKSPDIILIDTRVIKNSPQKYLKAGICDILSNYTALFDWNLAINKNMESKNDIAKIISSTSFWNLFNLPSNIEDDLKIKIIAESIILSGISMEIKGNTRPCSGSEHLFAHSITTYYPSINILHGYLVGLGSLVVSLFQKQNYNKLISFLKKNKIDVRPSTLGITKEIFIDAWLKAKSTRPNRYTILNEITLNIELLANIYDKIEKEA